MNTMKKPEKNYTDDEDTVCSYIESRVSDMIQEIDYMLAQDGVDMTAEELDAVLSNLEYEVYITQPKTTKEIVKDV